MTEAVDDRLKEAAQAAGWYLSTVWHRQHGVGKSLTPEEIRARRDVIEFLVCELIRLSDRCDYTSDHALYELHNAMIWKVWKELDALSMLAGGNPSWTKHGHGPDYSECETPAECARYRFVAAYNRLMAEVEPDAHIASVEITVHNMDGTEVSYGTGIDLNPLNPRQPLQRIIHDPDHGNCLVIYESDSIPGDDN